MPGTTQCTRFPTVHSIGVALGVEGGDSTDVDPFFDGTTSDSDGAIVVDCNDVVWPIAFATQLCLPCGSCFADLISHLVFVWDSLVVFALVVALDFLPSALLDCRPISFEFDGEYHVSAKHQLRWGCS